MSAEESHECPSPITVVPSRRRPWCQFSLRTLFVVVTVVACFLSWLTYRAEREATAAAQLKELKATVVFESRRPEWLWSLCGERIGHTVVSVDDVTSDNATAVASHLKALSNLRNVNVIAPGRKWIDVYRTRGENGYQVRKRYERKLDDLKKEFQLAAPSAKVEIWRLPD